MAPSPLSGGGAPGGGAGTVELEAGGRGGGGVGGGGGADITGELDEEQGEAGSLVFFFHLVAEYDI